MPKSNVYILSDYYINLLTQKTDYRYEDCFISFHYTPLISTYTHDRHGSKISCIDNIFTNNTHNIVLSGTISDKISHHLPIFQFTSLDITLSKKIEKHTQKYDYSNKKLINFVNELAEVIPHLTPDKATDFFSIYKSILNKHRKLRVPKTTKRNNLNNPWITDGIIEAINRKYE